MIFFTIHIQPFINDSNSRNNNLQGFKNSQVVMRGGVVGLCRGGVEHTGVGGLCRAGRVGHAGLGRVM